MTRSILDEILGEIKPSKEEERNLRIMIDEFLKKLSKINDAKPVLGGSGAKNTYLRATHDADIFVKFNYRKFSGNSFVISDILHKFLKKNFKKVARLHGSRDYFQININGFTFEIVPILDISNSEKSENITDTSPLHAKWVKKYPELTDEIRLAKAFCRANGLYGAESYINGFSGYVLEILVIFCGSFMNLLKASQKWKHKQVIDIMKYHKHPFIEVNKSKLQSPIIVIDPVQPGRNAAAALSEEKYTQFISAARAFLKKPSKSFFKPKEFNLEKVRIKHKSRNLILLKVKPKPGTLDVEGTKILKVFEKISRQLERNEFKIVDNAWHWDKKNPAILYFALDKKLLPAEKVLEGPPVKVKMHAEIFKKKHKKTFVKTKRLYAKVRREFRNPQEFVKKLLKDKQITGKIKKIEIIK